MSACAYQKVNLPADQHIPLRDLHAVHTVDPQMLMSQRTSPLLVVKEDTEVRVSGTVVAFTEGPMAGVLS